VFTPEREGGESVVGVLASKGDWGEEASGENDPSLVRGRASMTGNNLQDVQEEKVGKSVDENSRMTRD
jgi:hypothetical protein